MICGLCSYWTYSWNIYIYIYIYIYASSDFVSQTGSISKSLSKPQGGISSSKPLLSLQQTSFSKIKSKYIFKTAFQNILTMEDGFYHENPSIAALKIFPPKWYYKPWNLAKPQSYYATILEITDSVKFKHFKLHSDIYIYIVWIVWDVELWCLM